MTMSIKSCKSYKMLFMHFVYIFYFPSVFFTIIVCLRDWLSERTHFFANSINRYYSNSPRRISIAWKQCWHYRCRPYSVKCVRCLPCTPSAWPIGWTGCWTAGAFGMYVCYSSHLANAAAIIWPWVDRIGWKDTVGRWTLYWLWAGSIYNV